MRCYFCKNEDHYRNECPSRKGKKFDKFESSNDSDSNLVSEGYESFKVLIANLIGLKLIWLLIQVFPFTYHPLRII